MSHQRRDENSDLLALRNVGRAVVRYFNGVGITQPGQLAGRDPIELYEQMCAAGGRREDLCLLDTVMSAVDQANGNPARPWWDTQHSASDYWLAKATRGAAGDHVVGAGVSAGRRRLRL